MSVASRTSRKVVIIGAGLSGLTTAYFLNKYGIEVEVFEHAPRVGGLLGTRMSKYGPIETAANGFLASLTLEQMALDLGVNLQTTRPEARRRFFFDQTLRRWPLSLAATCAVFCRVIKMFFVRSAPMPFEPLKNWTERVLGRPFFSQIVAVALQGIYAGNPEQMSATLVVGRFFDRRKSGKSKRGRLRGTVSPAGGMGEWIQKLRAKVEARGVVLHLESAGRIAEEDGQIYVIATDVKSAAQLLQTAAPQAAAVLAQTETLPLVTATLFFKSRPQSQTERPRGFGVLFSAVHPVLGALLNDWIFSGRAEMWSETWILGGARNPEVMQLSDDQVLERILQTRALAFAEQEAPLETHITRWPQALPHYTVQLEKALSELQLPKGIFLVGNYLGRIGLSQIIEQAKEQAQTIAKSVGEANGT